MSVKSSRVNVWLVSLWLLFAMAATPALAQISFNDFSSVTGLALNGSTAQAVNGSGQNVLRLTADGTSHVSGTAWFATQQQTVDQGFTTVFQFQITHASTQADGLTFIIQNSAGDGFGTAARGGSGGAIGYGVPDAGDNGVAIPNSLAVEFDTYQNSWDPNANHIAIQSCGTDANTQDHTAICPDLNPANLGIVSDLGGINLSDGNVHTAVIDYDPGTLRVFVDNFGTPLLVVNTTLSTLLNLNNGSAWVGFGGATGLLTETNDIQSWTFTPANAQTTITQTLTPSPQPVETNYLYGSYNHKLQYSNANSGDNVAVTAIPIDQTTFDSTRLSGTPFSNAQCVIYDGTGGLCVEFEVVCTGSSDCTNLPYDLFNNFNTTQTITGACVLQAQIGTNNWQNIIETFTQTRNDPGGKSGSKGFSDFIVGQNCTALPSVVITSPANGSTVIAGQSVTIGFTCSTDPSAPLVTITSCTGLLNGSPVNNGDVVTFNTVGPGTLVVTAADSVQDSSTQTSNFTVGQAPAFTSANNATFQVGVLGSFIVTTTGFPAPSIAETSALPSGVTLVSHGDGTATLSGTPAANTGGAYNVTLMASNSAGNTSQPFVLTVLQTPAITSTNNVTFQAGVFGSFTVTTTGFPTPSITESGGLPGGVGFVDNGNGTGTLSGKPASGGTFNISFSANNTAGTATQPFILSVLQTPVITSANNTTFQVGVLGSFLVTATGSPTPSLTESGALPNGVGFQDNGNGTGTLTGTPTVSGTFNITFKATNTAGSGSQSFTLTVIQTPAITSANNTSFQVGVLGSFTVTASGYPTPSLTESGAFPNGVGFRDNGNGTGTLSGTPTVSGTFNISFKASNSAGSGTQNFTLTVTGGVQVSITPSSLNFGTVYYLSLLAKNVTLQNTGTATLQINKVAVVLGNADWDDFTFLNFCGSSLKPGKSCVITVFFFADDLGTRTATLTITDNAPGSPQQVPLSGTVIKKGH